VFLLELVPDGRGGLMPFAQHLCGADVYQLFLRMDKNRIEASWIIDGPKKQERLGYHYWQ
jgi:hypothetical protein